MVTASNNSMPERKVTMKPHDIPPQTPEQLATVRGVVAELLGQRGPVEDDTPLLSSGRFDSMGFVELVVELQMALGIQLPVGRVRPDDFDTVLLISDTITKLRHV